MMLTRYTWFMSLGKENSTPVLVRGSAFRLFSRDTCHNPIPLLPMAIFYRFICESTIRIGGLWSTSQRYLHSYFFNIILRATIYYINYWISAIINHLIFKAWIRHRKTNMRVSSSKINTVL